MKRIEALQAGYDSTREIGGDELAKAAYLRFSSAPCDLEECKSSFGSHSHR